MKKQLRRPRLRQDNIKTNVKELGCEAEDWIK